MYQVKLTECQNVAGGVTIAQIRENLSEAYSLTHPNLNEFATVGGMIGVFAGLCGAAQKGGVPEYLFQPVVGALVIGTLSAAGAYLYEFSLNAHEAFKAS